MKHSKQMTVEHDYALDSKIRFTGTHVIPREQYRAHPALNQSYVKKVLESGLNKAKHDLANPEPATEDMVIGLAHHAILSDIPGALSDFVVHPKIDRRTTAGKQAWAELMTSAADGKILISDESFERAQLTAASARDAVATVFGGKFKHEHSELSLVSKLVIDHKGDVTEVEVKGQIDVVGRLDGELKILDYKTAQMSVSKSKVFHKAMDSHWFMQAYLYSAMLASLRNEEVEPTYVVTSKEDAVSRMYGFSKAMLDMGQSEFVRGVYRIRNQTVSDVEYAGITIL